MAVFAIGALPAAADDQITLTYSCFFPPSHVQSKLADAWCKEVGKRTKGKVLVQYFPGQTLTKAKQMYDGVVQGMSDLGFCLFGYNRGRFPLMEVVDLPLGYKSGKAATTVANAVYGKFKPKELDDVQVMYLNAHGPGILFTKGKAVKKMADMKGLKIRSHGTTAKVVKALGGTPVAMPMPELYQALQRGVVDGALYPMEVNKGWKMADVVNYCTENYANAYTSTFYVVMNKGKWNSLPKDVQEIIIQINKEWIPKHGAAWDASDEAGRKLMLKKGRKFIPLSAAEAARWKKATDPVLDEYVKETSAKGVPAKEALEFTKKKLAEVQK
ncbi:MAG: TRAP transporter substrate-binding protein [Desulfarculaceae bacterium]|nr:TRAP transporter substrate-binding protein [Desulfarculaceae bacterium]MCF8071365.1 TRAP transporter substrate-binding protein [Desulfarculaceae bacterium]MCF8101690.1 TRAP transporter substrate-binding protein [Desulfarculaceae bacterium]MCF8116701.1 TRAP transporter substrate-binding protein [Desulfarculaceae bacterium]